MAVAWTLRDARVTSAIVGARNTQQLDETLEALNNLTFETNELSRIDELTAYAEI